MITEKVRRTLHCDKKGCTNIIEWNPNLEPHEVVPPALKEALFIQHALTGHATVHCSQVSM
jgi:hypothetical protein